MIHRGLGGRKLYYRQNDAWIESANTSSAQSWVSGASGEAAKNGMYGTWRGRPVEIIGTWADTTLQDHINQWPVNAAFAGEPFSLHNWQYDIDLAIGAIYGSETWALAAGGAYDSRWTQVLQLINQSRSGKPGRINIRFAHEFNGDWYPWKVTGMNASNFVTAWRRFHGLFKQHMDTKHRLVWNPNSETAGSLGLDVRSAFPGAAYVDVMSVDKYNQYPHVISDVQMQSEMTRVAADGSPIGIEAHRLYAELQGKPFALPEWSNNGWSGAAGGGGESLAFINGLRSWMEQHAGTGPGNLLYEIQFNVENFGKGDGINIPSQFQFYPISDAPNSASRYAELWRT